MPLSAKALCLVCVDGELPGYRALVPATQRLRGAILREAVRACLPDHERALWEDLDEAQREGLSGLSGKDAQGRPLVDLPHLAVFPWYAQQPGEPDRLYLWKPDGIAEHEAAAIHAAIRRPVRIETGVLRLAPFGRLDLPVEWAAPSCVWESLTAFVPAATRHRFRPNGKPKNSEAPERQAAKLCVKAGLPEPEVEGIGDGGAVRIHWNLEVRQNLSESRPATHWPGYGLRLTFPEPVAGPLFLGHSCHFGLGLFGGAA